jgi:hypothetical protein
MPAYTSYSRLPDGRVQLTDDQGGQLTLLDSPSVKAEMDRIDAAQPAAPEVVPDGIVVAQSPTMTAQRAQVPNTLPTPPAEAPAPIAGGSPLVPPAPLVNVAPPTGGSPLVPQAATPEAPAAAAPAPPAPAPASPGPIARAGAGSTGPTPGNAAANLYAAAAEAELRGSPGTFVPGGTFKTGATQQYAPGPDPAATASREDAERQRGLVDQSLAWVEARKNQELNELAQAEAARAAERQKKIDELQAKQAEKLGGVLGQIDAKRKDIADAKLDPNRLIKEMSTGQQVLVGIFQLIGAFGHALADKDGPSLAMQTLDEALKTDLEMQKYAVDQKRGDLNTLGEIYKLTKEQFGDEKMAMDAAYIAGLDIYKAKIQKTISEADAAMGVETQYDADGKIIAGAPYSMRAQKVLADLAVEQARLKEQLSQAANGQIAQQFQTVPDKVVGGKAPNFAKAAEYLDKAEKAAGGSGQQVTYDGKKYKIASFAEAGEGKDLRKELGDIEVLKKDLALLERELREHPIDSKTFNKSKVLGLMERSTSKANVVLGQGSKNNEEAARWEKIVSSVLTNGVGAVEDMHRWADDMARSKLDQVNATPAGASGGGGVRLGDRTRAVIDGKPIPMGGGVVGMPRQGGGAPAPVVRASGVRATPLDRAGASLVTATTTRDERTRARAVETAKAAISDSVRANQLGPGEARVALQLAEAGDIEGLLSFLGRMRGAVSTAPQPSLDDFNRQVSNQLLLQELKRAGRASEAALSSPVSVTVTTGAGGGKKGGSAPAVKPQKPVNLSGKKGK